MKIGNLLKHLLTLEATLGAELRAAAERHHEEHDVYHQCRLFARSADARAERLEPLLARLHEGSDQWNSAGDAGSDDLLEELRALALRLRMVDVTWTMAEQAAKALRDADLLACATESAADATSEADWFLTRIKTGAPQALTVE
jgi:ribonuclease HI